MKLSHSTLTGHQAGSARVAPIAAQEERTRPLRYAHGVGDGAPHRISGSASLPLRDEAWMLSVGPAPIDVPDSHSALRTHLQRFSFTARVSDIVNVRGLSSPEFAVFAGMIGASRRITGVDRRIAGRDPQALTKAERHLFLLKHVGSALSHERLLPHLTVHENLCLPLLINDVAPAHAASEHATAELLRLGLGHVRDLIPEDLAPSEVHLALLARATIHRPSVVLCDWPDDVFDPDESAIVRSSLWRCASLGASVVLSSADRTLASLATTTIWLGSRADEGP
jgi:putative ABC transport system ATP-binding protein